MACPVVVGRRSEAPLRSPSTAFLSSTSSSRPRHPSTVVRMAVSVVTAFESMRLSFWTTSDAPGADFFETVLDSALCELRTAVRRPKGDVPSETGDEARALVSLSSRADERTRLETCGRVCAELSGIADVD